MIAGLGNTTPLAAFKLSLREGLRKQDFREFSTVCSLGYPQVVDEAAGVRGMARDHEKCESAMSRWLKALSRGVP